MYMDGQNQLDFLVQININVKRTDVAAGGHHVLDLSETSAFCRALLVFEMDINGVFGRFFFSQSACSKTIKPGQ